MAHKSLTGSGVYISICIFGTEKNSSLCTDVRKSKSGLVLPVDFVIESPFVAPVENFWKSSALLQIESSILQESHPLQFSLVSIGHFPFFGINSII